MIEATATVLSYQRGSVTLAWRTKSSCSHCEKRNDCGTGVMARALRTKPNQLTLPCDTEYLPGTELRLGIEENQLLKASALVYLLPLLGLLVGAGVAQGLSQSEPVAIALAALGGFGGFAFARWRSAGNQQQIRILGVAQDSAVRE